MARRITGPTVPAHWHVADVARVRGQVLTPGREVTFRDADGQAIRGRFAFVRHVTHTTTGRQWLDVRDSNGALRAFYVDRVRTVARTRKMRQAGTARQAVAA